MKHVFVSFGVAFGLLLTGCGSDDSGGAEPGGAGKGGSTAGGAGGGEGGAAKGGQGGMTNEGGAQPIGPLACEPFSPCGGTLTGTWHVNNSCVSDATKVALAAKAKVCDAGTATLHAWKIEGTTTFDAQSVVYDGAVTLSFSTTFPLSCLGDLATCKAFEASLGGQQGVTKPVCQSAAAGCSCSYDQVIQNKSQAGYTQKDSAFTETNPSDGTMEPSEYCVQGTTLRVKSATSVDVYTR